MVTATRPPRSAIGLRALSRVGVDVSPEFAAALFPRPREKIVTGGWQAGKSFEGAAELFVPIFTDIPFADEDREFRYWVIVPSYRAPRKEMDYLLEWCTKAAIPGLQHHFPDGSSCRISLFGGKIIFETKTAEDPEGIAGEPCDGVLVVEAGQMPEVIRTQCQGRIITRRGWITYTGTLEDDEAKPRYVWYGKLAGEWRDSPTPDAQAFSLPSWANRTVFPDGRQDEEIKRQELILGDHAFKRRIAGIASGSQYPIYPQLAQVPQMFSAYGVPAGHDRWIYSMGAGGHDHGDTPGHMTTLAVITVNDRNEKWVREVRRTASAGPEWVGRNRREMSTLYRVPWHRWGYDPMQREAAKDNQAMVAGAAGSRSDKVRMVEEDLQKRQLWFDLDGPGVKEALEQMGRVHYIKKTSPERGDFWDYHRSDDDDAAAIEDARYVIEYGPTAPPAAAKVVQEGKRPKPQPYAGMGSRA